MSVAEVYKSSPLNSLRLWAKNVPWDEHQLPPVCRRPVCLVQLYRGMPARVILNALVIHLRLTVRTIAETTVFARGVDRRTVPSIGGPVDAPQVCGPLVVQEIRTADDGTITCEVGNLKEPLPEPQPPGMQNIQLELWDLAHAGWRREG